MARPFRDRKLRTVGRLLQLLKLDEQKLSGGPGLASPVWYRGLSRASYNLVPTLHVKGLDPKDEVFMMNKFRQDAHKSLEGREPASEWEWMFLMRHHGSPSRLLDWSENPLVGLYFATEVSDDAKTEDGALWCLLPLTLNRWSLGWPSDSSALPMFTVDTDEFPRGENETLLNYLPSYMRDLRRGAKSLAPAAAMSIRTSPRIQAQLGTFTIHHANSTPLENYEDHSHVWRFTVPAEAKAAIRSELRRIGIMEMTLFPELDNLAAEAAGALKGR